ncbi:hypothetical protein B7486_33800 [cyanobacterium TDX16]|nr:hypothetical protein B7486_33800 [cyanobacterium TDX16]
MNITLLTRRKILGAFFLSGLLLTGSVSYIHQVSAQTPAVETTANREAYVRDELYFGRSQPGGGEVTAEQWQKFVDTEVTPRFPDGLTVIDAYGQFLNSAGILAREDSKVLILLYVSTPERERSIQGIIDAYKSKFQQESVLRVTDVPARVSF